MLHRMHAQPTCTHTNYVIIVALAKGSIPRERLRVYISMVQRMNKSVQHSKMQHSMSPIEMELAKYRNCGNLRLDSQPV